jgi:hypothetical protein
MLTDGESILRRLAARSRAEGQCLVWTGARHSNGYGSITIGGRRGKRESVHRAAWTARHGEPPAETPYVLHRCDNPPCWRDDHLFLGTHADNMADMDHKGRRWTSQRRCEDAPGAKLTNAQVAEIKRRLTAGDTQKLIADTYGVSKVAIGHIWRGRNFLEVPWPSSGERFPPWMRSA